jgi:hypothetical protein
MDNKSLEEFKGMKKKKSPYEKLTFQNGIPLREPFCEKTTLVKIKYTHPLTG